jgi:hypothetical protein
MWKETAVALPHHFIQRLKKNTDTARQAVSRQRFPSRFPEHSAGTPTSVSRRSVFPDTDEYKQVKQVIRFPKVQLEGTVQRSSYL